MNKINNMMNKLPIELEDIIYKYKHNLMFSDTINKLDKLNKKAINGIVEIFLNGVKLYNVKNNKLIHFIKTHLLTLNKNYNFDRRITRQAYLDNNNYEQNDICPMDSEEDYGLFEWADVIYLNEDIVSPIELPFTFYIIKYKNKYVLSAS